MARTISFDIGDQPILTATFTDAEGVAADPTTIVFSLKSPDGVVVTGNETDATNPAVGVWKWEIPSAFNKSGAWYFRAEATSGLQTAEEIAVVVRQSNVVIG